MKALALKTHVFLLLLIVCSGLTAQNNDSLFRWSIRFNQKLLYKDSCLPRNFKPDTIFLEGRINHNYDTILNGKRIYYYYDTLWFSYNDALFHDPPPFNSHFPYVQYYLEFRDNEDKLIHIESSFYNQINCFLLEPPFTEYDSIIGNYYNISVNLAVLPFNTDLDVYFSKSWHKEKFRLCTLDFATRKEEK
jgi:hypothetical protein